MDQSVINFFHLYSLLLLHVDIGTITSSTVCRYCPFPQTLTCIGMILVMLQFLLIESCTRPTITDASGASRKHREHLYIC